jgi:MSHA pilin protein MshD
MRNPVTSNRLLRGQQGVTLVELIVSMVIISIALGGVLMVMNFTTSHSADPMIQHQAVAIAEAYMEEILLQGYKNPTAGYTGAVREYFDDVDDYKQLPTNDPANDHNGSSVGLDTYEVTVMVGDPEDFGPTDNPVLAKKITVTVNHSAMGDLILTGYRINY